MAYIGREPQIGNYQVCDAISVVNAQAAYTMQVNSVNVIPESVNHMIVSLNGVIQKPGSSYTISSSTITFSSNLATGDSIDFIYLLGNTLDLGTPSDDAVTGAKIVDNAINSEHYTDGSIDTAHIADLNVTTGKIAADAITGAKIADNAINSEHYTDGSIDTAHIADAQITTAKLSTAVFTGATDIGADLADADLFLVDDGAGGTLRKTAASRLKTYVGGGITQADQWRLSANLELSTNDITANLERVDDAGFGYIGSGMSQSSGTFTFPATGIYRVEVNATFSKNTDGDGARYMMVRTQTTTNNSSYNNVARAITNINDWIANTVTSSCASIIYLDVTNTSNVKVKFTTSSATGSDHFLDGTTADNYTTFTFTRLGDT